MGPAFGARVGCVIATLASFLFSFGLRHHSLQPRDDVLNHDGTVGLVHQLVPGVVVEAAADVRHARIGEDLQQPPDAFRLFSDGVGRAGNDVNRELARVFLKNATVLCATRPSSRSSQARDVSGNPQSGSQVYFLTSSASLDSQVFGGACGPNFAL